MLENILYSIVQGIAKSQTQLSEFHFKLHTHTHTHTHTQTHTYGPFPNGSSSKESAYNAGDTGDVGSIPRSGRSPQGGNGNPLQYSSLENSMEGGAWWATVHGVPKSQTQLSHFH